MDAPEQRYSDALKEFDGTVKGAGEVACAEFKDAFEAAVAAATKDGKEDGRELVLGELVANLPRELAVEGRAFLKRTEQEIRYRGEEWHRVALIPAFREYLTALQ